jgi:D-alanyl-D-alanine dipeptidase
MIMTFRAWEKHSAPQTVISAANIEPSRDGVNLNTTRRNQECGVNKSLVPVTGIPCLLMYHLAGRPRAVPHAFLAEVTLNALLVANQSIAELTAGRCGLLCWDAYRTYETQQALFDEQMALARRAHPDKTEVEIELLVANHVQPPRRDPPPPHTTGGAVDVTLLRNGKPLALGTFDDFTQKGAADYFDTHDPKDETEALEKWGRELVRDAMLAAGFVGIQQEWWHFEMGTRHWSAVTGNPLILDTVLASIWIPDTVKKWDA